MAESSIERRGCDDDRAIALRRNRGEAQRLGSSW
jgi:hypothetical protein